MCDNGGDNKTLKGQALCLPRSSRVVKGCVFECTDPNETAKDMIEAYKKECVAMRVRPVAKLLEQLEVGPPPCHSHPLTTPTTLTLLFYVQRLDDLSTPIDTLDLRGGPMCGACDMDEGCINTYICINAAFISHACVCVSCLMSCDTATGVKLDNSVM